MRRKSRGWSRLTYLAVGCGLLFAALSHARQPVTGASTGDGSQPRSSSREADPARLGRLAFSHFTDHDGLPQNAIQAMSFDHKGYLWVGTQDGAAYYNGRVWAVVNMPDRTASNFVRSILVASDDSIWFGRQEGGVSRLKDGNWMSFDERGALPDKRVNALLETRAADGQQLIWIGTDKGLAQLNGNAWRRFDAHHGLPDDRVTSLLETKDENG